MTPAVPPAQTLASLADALGGKLTGDGTLPVTGVARPQDAAGPTELALAMDTSDLRNLASARTRIAVVAQGASVPDDSLAGYIEVRRPRMALAILTNLFAQPLHAWAGRHPSAVVDPGATIGANVSIGALVRVGPGASIGDNTVLMPHVVIGADAVVGKDCLLHAGVQVGERVSIGNRVIVHMNAVIGADGFSFVTTDPTALAAAKISGQAAALGERVERINSLGTVIVHDDVELGAGVTVDRATIAATVIGRGTKIDNLVVIAHNCVIGENCMMSGQVGIAGSTTVGDRCVLGGQAGVADHIVIGNDSIVAAKSKAVRNVPAKTVAIGFPATTQDLFVAEMLNETRMSRYFRKADDIARRLDAIAGKAEDTAGSRR